eukprot:222514-Amorphochlora_amoeboformis.AAC.1
MSPTMHARGQFPPRPCIMTQILTQCQTRPVLKAVILYGAERDSRATAAPDEVEIAPVRRHGRPCVVSFRNGLGAEFHPCFGFSAEIRN